MLHGMKEQILRIKLVTVSELMSARNFDALLQEYGAESAIPELGGVSAQRETYERLEAAGVLSVFGAYLGSNLVGFLAIIMSHLPHYGALVGTTESFFVTPSARGSGAGAKLLREAEDFASALGAVGVFVSAPVGSKLDTLLEVKRGYRRTNHVYFKGLA